MAPRHLQLQNAGDTTALVPFSLRLEGCPPGFKRCDFIARTPASDITNLLALDDPQWHVNRRHRITLIAIAPGSH